MRLLLLDMDNVLLEPGGYRRALQYTVAEAGRALGYRGPLLTPEEIEEIEACGVTSEWEMSAICTAVMMEGNRQQGREIVLPRGLPPSEDLPQAAEPPGFLAFFRRLAELNPAQSALERAGQLLMDGHLAAEAGGGERTIDLLMAARTPAAVTFRTIQELVLGSDIYAETYGREPILAAPSYLDRFDRSNLSAQLAVELRDWLAGQDRQAVIFTNRPNRPPPGYADTPEAELGANLVGLEGLPLVGSGDMGWLADRLGRKQYAFLKPSPVHALTALQLALGQPKEEAILAAHSLAEGSDTSASVWEELNGAQVTVFEDSRRGMDSAMAARELLAENEVRIDLELAGVASNSAKVDELQGVGAAVYSSIEQALRALVLT